MNESLNDFGLDPVNEPQPESSTVETFSSDPNLKEVKDSGWLPDYQSPSHRTHWQHSLGVTPRIVQIFFSPNPGGSPAYPVMWSWSTNMSGNPVTVSVNDEYVNLEIYGGNPLHGVWNPDTAWTRFSKGYWRIFVVA